MLKSSLHCLSSAFIPSHHQMLPKVPRLVSAPVPVPLHFDLCGPRVTVTETKLIRSLRQPTLPSENPSVLLMAHKLQSMCVGDRGPPSRADTPPAPAGSVQPRNREPSAHLCLDTCLSLTRGWLSPHSLYLLRSLIL